MSASAGNSAASSPSPSPPPSRPDSRSPLTRSAAAAAASSSSAGALPAHDGRYMTTSSSGSASPSSSSQRRLAPGSTSSRRTGGGSSRRSALANSAQAGHSHSSSSLDAPPSPSTTSQSAEEQDDDGRDVGDDDDDDDFADLGASTFNLNERRMTLKGAPGAVVDAQSQGNRDTTSWDIHVNTYDQRPGPTNLPHEIFLHIFKYVMTFPPDLRNCLLVCKAWCLCGVELLWHRPTFYRLSSLIKLLHVVRRPDQTFPYSNFIRRLNFSLLSAELTEQLFFMMPDCSRLERLTLAGCSDISDDPLMQLLSNTHQLVAIDLTDVAKLTDETIKTIARNCPRLQGINMSGCKQLTSESVAMLAQASPLLRRVKLCGCENISDEALFALTEHCPMLLEVDLMYCPNITDASVRTIWERSWHLRELRLAQCGKLTDLAFPKPLRSSANSTFAGDDYGGAARSGPSLAQLNEITPNGSSRARGTDSAPITRVTSPFGAGGEAGSASQGSDLALARTSTLPSHGPGGLYRPAPPRQFDHLRIIDLTNCSTISDASIEGIIDHVPKIRNLILAKCTRLTDESLYAISRLGKNLHYLHLGHVSNITDRAVIHLARSCTRLRYIDLACCLQLTDLSVFELASNLPKLRRIGLVRVSNLTDQAIFALVDRYTSLERIHLSYCENISVPAIFWLLLKLTRLTHLSLTGVPAFRKPELQSMCRQPPKDFNAHQRQAFCVYSGKGVNELRKFLSTNYENPAMEAELGPLTTELRSAITILMESREASRHSERYRALHASSSSSGKHHHHHHAAAAAAAGGGHGHYAAHGHRSIATHSHGLHAVDAYGNVGGGSSAAGLPQSLAPVAHTTGRGLPAYLDPIWRSGTSDGFLGGGGGTYGHHTASAVPRGLQTSSSSRAGGLAPMQVDGQDHLLGATLRRPSSSGAARGSANVVRSSQQGQGGGGAMEGVVTRATQSSTPPPSVPGAFHFNQRDAADRSLSNASTSAMSLAGEDDDLSRSLSGGVGVASGEAASTAAGASPRTTRQLMALETPPIQLQGEGEGEGGSGAGRAMAGGNATQDPFAQAMAARRR